MKKKIYVAVMLCIFVIGLSYAEVVVVNDHFDDGDVTTNTAGTGTGFNSGIFSSATIVEADSFVSLNNNNNGADRAVITSKDAAGIGSGITRFEFKGLTFALSVAGTGTGPARTVVGVKNDDLADNPDDNTKPGFYVQFECDSFSNTANDGAWNGTSALIYVAVDGTRTVLARWEYDTLNWDSGTQDFTPVIDVTLDLEADGYSLAIEGDTITLLSGSLSNTYAAAGITNELTSGYAYVFNQTEFPLIHLSVDQIIVTENAVSGGVRPYDPAAIPQNSDGSVGTVNLPALTVTDVDLTFKAGKDPNFAENGVLVNPAIEQFNIYFQTGAPTDPNLYLVDAIGQGSLTDPNRIFPLSAYNPGAGVLMQGTTYKWQVEQVMKNPITGIPYEQGDPNNIVGSVWTFTTASAVPNITINPVHTLTDVSGSATLTITASATADNFRWFKVVGEQDSSENAETDDLELSDGGIYSTTTTATLTITGQASNGTEDAQYYAIAYNGVPGEELTQASSPSATAWVWYPREVHRYTFEGTYVDGDNTFVADTIGISEIQLMSADGGPDLASLDSNNPDAPGLVGSQSLYLNNPNASDPNNADGQYGQINDSMIGAYADISIAAWIYHKGGGWQRILSLGNNNGEGTGPANNEYLYLTPSANATSGQLRLEIRGQNVTAPGGSVPENEWAHVMATLSGDTAKLYVNGEWVATNTINGNPIDSAPTVDNWLGRSQWYNWDTLFNGYIADLRIWNYGLSNGEVAQAYMDDDTNATYVCDEEVNDLGYDWNGNCIIDLGDFAILAQAWLDSDRFYPAP